MEAESRGFPYRWFLPLTQLSVCVSLLWPYSALLRRQFWPVSRIQLLLPPALNLPVMFAQLPYVIANPDKTEWLPNGIPLEVWRATSWPFAGLLFWWLAGRGMEALDAALHRRKVSLNIRWVEALVGLFEFVSGGLTVAVSISDTRQSLLMMTLGAGGGLWMILGAVVVVAKFLQWRLRREQRRASAQTISSEPGFPP